MTTIGPNTLVEGRIEGGEDLTVEGRVVGTIQLSELLFVAAGGHIHGNASARGVRVDGLVDGQILATEFIHLSATAVVRATLTAPIIRMDDGARLSGDVVMDVDAPAPQTAIPAARVQPVTERSAPAKVATPAKPAPAKPVPARPAAPTPAPAPKPEPAPKPAPVATPAPAPVEPPTVAVPTPVASPAPVPAPVAAPAQAALIAVPQTTTTVVVDEVPHKYDALSVKELRERLRDLDLPVSGTKQDLMERLAEAEG